MVLNAAIAVKPDNLAASLLRAVHGATFKTIAGENIGDVAFELDGNFLSAREDGSVLMAGACYSWECFSPIALDQFADLVWILTNDWVLRESGERHAAHTIKMGGRKLIEIGSHRWSLDEILPLFEPIRYEAGPHNGLPARILLFRDGWKCDELIRYQPLVIFVMFGSGPWANQFRLATASLSEIGRYDGQVLVITDQSRSYVESLMPHRLRDHLLIEPMLGLDRLDFVGARLTIGNIPDISHYQPAVYADLDVIFDLPIEPILRKLVVSDRMTAQVEPYAPIAERPSVGGTLIEMDASKLGTQFGFNAGIMGFPDLHRFGRVLRAMYHCLSMHTAARGRTALEWHDQPIANYIAGKLDVFDPTLFTEATRIPPFDGVLDPSTPTGFVHFWPSGSHIDNKAEQMRSYVATFRSVN